MSLDEFKRVRPNSKTSNSKVYFEQGVTSSSTSALCVEFNDDRCTSVALSIKVPHEIFKAELNAVFDILFKARGRDFKWMVRPMRGIEFSYLMPCLVSCK
jgi:hypothetical protein